VIVLALDDAHSNGWDSIDAATALSSLASVSTKRLACVAMGPQHHGHVMSANIILMVDDNPENLELLLAMLSARGYDLRTAIDAQQAEQILVDLSPTLILLDLQLPGMDGFELTRKLKAEPRTRHIPIIAVTAYAMKGDEKRARDAGCDGYLSKPIDKHALRALVAGYVQPDTLAEDAR
jgi:two-component system cell cycle response regulator